MSFEVEDLGEVLHRLIHQDACARLENLSNSSWIAIAGIFYAMAVVSLAVEA